MHIVVVLACLACTGYARKVRFTTKRESGISTNEATQQMESSSAVNLLATVLLASGSSAAFNPTSIGGISHARKLDSRISTCTTLSRLLQTERQGSFNSKHVAAGDLSSPAFPRALLSEPARTNAPHLSAAVSSSRNTTLSPSSSPPSRSGGLLRRLLKVLQSSPVVQGLRQRLLILWNKIRRRPLIPILILLTIASKCASAMRSPAPRPLELTYAAFMQAVEAKDSLISDLRISPKLLSFLYDGRPAFTVPVMATPDLLQTLLKSGIDFRAPTRSAVSAFLPLLFPILYLLGSWTIMRQAMGGGKTRSVGKKGGSSFRLSTGQLSFDDVAGIDAAKDEVQEIVSMLKQPWKYTAAGARLPKGVLMAGPPGTGKTLLARVMAATAGVPFYYCSGSDFVELFVGRGAARMRSLFKEAEKTSPCLIFVDELDALGKQRSLRISGSNDEAEQTLNQMLACMDGVDTVNNGVIVMAATNRYEILDPALTRPGRFDRVVRINLPDEAGRVAILRVHTRKLQLDADVDFAKIAEETPSYSGAELAALANEAAIRAVRRSSNVVNQADFLSAADTFNLGRGRMPSVDKFISSLMPGGNGNNPSPSVP